VLSKDYLTVLELGTFLDRLVQQLAKWLAATKVPMTVEV